MKRTLRNEEQTMGILQEHEAGAKCAASMACRKAKYSGMAVSEARRLKALEDENAKLKKLLAERIRPILGRRSGGRARLPGLIGRPSVAFARARKISAQHEVFWKRADELGLTEEIAPDADHEQPVLAVRGADGAPSPLLS